MGEGTRPTAGALVERDAAAHDRTRSGTTPAHFFGHDFIDLLRVIEERRRTGIGRALLRAAVTHAATPRVFSSTNESNHAMRALFAAEAWVFSGRLVGLDEGDPELVHFFDKSP